MGVLCSNMQTVELNIFTEVSILFFKYISLRQIYNFLLCFTVE